MSTRKKYKPVSAVAQRELVGEGWRSCPCHDEPMYWHPHSDRPAGGYYLCAVKERQRQLDRYDSDWRYRIEKNMGANRRKRLATLCRK